MTISKTQVQRSKQKTSMNLGGVYLTNRGSGKNIVLKTGTRSIGRKKAEILVSDDPMMSRTHCQFHVQNLGLCYIEDLGSTNKTFVNSQAIASHARILLREGDVIQVGRQMLEFHVGTPPKGALKKKAAAKSGMNPMQKVIEALRQLTFLSKH